MDTASGNPAKILSFGAAAGALGAIAWAGLIYVGAETAILAWVIGGAVGIGVLAGGGRGTNWALVAAALTVLSICAGKVAGIEFLYTEYINKEIAPQITIEVYNELVTDARDYVALESDDQLPDFMISHGYWDAEDPSEVPQILIEDFKDNRAPALKEFNANPPTFEQWKAERLDRVSAYIHEENSKFDMLKSTLGLFDIIFFALGILTAFKMVARNSN
ncbi:hypothetical protein KQI84_16430 [bacterium]|nr:hypothetical protein [bacterium]